MEARAYGYVDGKPAFSRDEFVLKSRWGHKEKFATPQDMVERMDKTGLLYYAGWKREFVDLFLDRYEIERCFCQDEFKALKAYQQELIQAEKAEDAARMWQKVHEIHWMDNSVEEIWRDKDGNEKSVLVVAPHGDACY